MTSPGGLLDFFTLEASDYVEQMDGLLAKAAGSGPDAEALLRNARALRGSSTMAKLPAIADLASAMERISRGLMDGAVAWDPALGGAMTAAVDDLKILVRAVRSWTPSENQRAATRSAELARYAPRRTAAPASPAATSGTTFFSAEASNIAAGLELLIARPDDRDAAANVLRRVRALRGVAGIKDVGPLSEVMESAELVMKPLELGHGGVSPQGMEVLKSGSELLRKLSAALRSGGPSDEPSTERDRFRTAVETFRGGSAADERIVPISQLFYDDGGQKVVSAAPHPPTTPAERFRLEMVSQGEHLQRLVADGRDAKDDVARDRVRRELTKALGALRAGAESFGESEVATLIAGHADAVEKLDYLSLNSLDALASVIAKPGAHGERLSARLVELKAGQSLDAGIGAALVGNAPALASPLTPSRAPTPIINPAIPRPAAPRSSAPIQTPVRVPAGLVVAQTPRSGNDLMAALDQSITGFEQLAEQPLSAPVPLDIPIVPIDVLLYRGRAAIERAIEIREEVRRAGGPPPREALDELFDLLDLALAE